MYNYIRDIVTDFKQYEPSNKNARTPAANHLFKVRDDQKKPPETLALVFHIFTARALFATKRDRPDIHTTVAFLTTRVLCPDDDIPPTLKDRKSVGGTEYLRRLKIGRAS